MGFDDNTIAYNNPITRDSITQVDTFPISDIRNGVYVEAVNIDANNPLIIELTKIKNGEVISITIPAGVTWDKTMQAFNILDISASSTSTAFVINIGEYTYAI